MCDIELKFAYLLKAFLQGYAQLRCVIYRDTGMAQRRKDRLRLQHIHSTSRDQWILIALMIGMLLAMLLGAWLGYNFKGEIIDAHNLISMNKHCG